MFSQENAKEIKQVYISKQSSNRENKVIFLMMITDGKKHDIIILRKTPKSLHKITSKHKDNHCCLNCLHSFRTEIKLKSHENVCKLQIIVQ